MMMEERDMEEEKVRIVEEMNDMEGKVVFV